VEQKMLLAPRLLEPCISNIKKFKVKVSKNLKKIFM
jgi:hypothetical protein